MTGCGAFLAAGKQVMGVTSFSLKNARRMRGEREDELLTGPCLCSALALVIPVDSRRSLGACGGFQHSLGRVSCVGVGKK